MYGDSTPGDVTHEQVALEYKTFFKDAFRKLPQNITGADKYELWEMASTMFTVSEIEVIFICIMHECEYSNDLYLYTGNKSSKE